MKTHHPSPRPFAADASIQEDQTTRSRFAPSWRLLTLAAEVSALLLVALAVGLLLSSCSGEKATSSEEDAGTQTVVAQSPVNASPSPQSTVVAQGGVPRMPESGAVGTVSTESLPPDIVVTASDTLVGPGESVEITARGTGDVVEIALWDGIHDKQAFVFDPTEKVWRATYRVPLRPAWERVGLSVTAKNEAHRWRRVWVFLSTGREAPAAPDSISN